MLPENISQQQRNERLSLLTEYRDYYLAHRLNQPKREIADYVESEGILVPKRYASLAEALASGKDFIMRTENPEEYSGGSGIGLSHVVSEYELQQARKESEEYGSYIDWDAFDDPTNGENLYFIIKSQLLTQIATISQTDVEDGLIHLDFEQIKNYCRAAEIDPFIYAAESSYSYWQFIEGYNRTVVADSAVPGRYHVFTSSEKPFYHKYCIVDGETITYIGPGGGWRFTEEMRTSLFTTIQAYEQVRNLDRFDPQHCPIMEFQSPADQPHLAYFLQYHRATDFQPTQFAIDREPEEGEYEAEFCRGATPPEGQTFTVHFDIWDDSRGVMPIDEDAAIDIHGDVYFTEAMLRKRNMQLLTTDLDSLALSAIDLHCPKSQLFKPPLSIVLHPDDYENIEPDGVNLRNYFKSKIAQTIRLHVLSDGRRAFVRKVEEGLLE